MVDRRRRAERRTGGGRRNGLRRRLDRARPGRRALPRRTGCARPDRRLDEAIAQAETERDVGALLLRDCGSPIDTRSLDDRHDLPRIIRARPPPGAAEALPARAAAIELEDESQLPDAVAEQARWGDGWVKLVGDWIDRDVGDLAPLWSDDVLKAAIDAAHANGARVTAHVFSEDALPGLINAGIDCIEHGTGLTDDTDRR